jgi:hypothetical protein
MGPLNPHPVLVQILLWRSYFWIRHWNYQKVESDISGRMEASDSDLFYVRQLPWRFDLVDIDFGHIKSRSKMPQSLIMKAAAGCGGENSCILVGNEMPFEDNSWQGFRFCLNLNRSRYLERMRRYSDKSEQGLEKGFFRHSAMDFGTDFWIIWKVFLCTIRQTYSGIVWATRRI